MADWLPDVLGEGYTQHTIELGADPDGQGDVVATVVRRDPPAQARAAVLYVHGYSDYFFNTELADFFTDAGYAFFAVDLRKVGRSIRSGQTPHFVSDLDLYRQDFDAALALVRDVSGGLPVIVGAHSTGGLSLPLWLHHLNRTHDGGTRGAGVVGFIANSPWFDLQGAPWMRTIGTTLIDVIGRLQPLREINLPRPDAYGTAIHRSLRGEWDYDFDWKPLRGYPVRFGWLRAVRRGHARLHRGLDIGVPSLVMRSDFSFGAREWSDKVDRSDVVLDVRQIARWAGCLGDAVTMRPVAGAMHDVFLSHREVRDEVYRVLGDWLTQQVEPTL